MSEPSTVFLLGPFAPGGRRHDVGYLLMNDRGVELANREDWRGETRFYPMCHVKRVELHTGWNPKIGEGEK